MIHIALSTFVLAAQAVWDDEVGDIGDYETARELGEHLDFVETNVLNLLRLGNFPQFYNNSYPMIEGCGCYYSPVKISFGSRIGLQCERMVGQKLKYDDHNCGPICNSPHSVDLVLFCPYGWQSDCERGCVPPDEFRFVQERINFWELTLTNLLMKGSEYIRASVDYLEGCGCEGKLRPVRYGTHIGFDCVLKEGALERISEACAGHSACLDEGGRQIMTFCPGGHRATCAGCEKVVEGNGFRSRVEWMINVVVGYTKESLDVLGWIPSVRQLIGCSCSTDIDRIQYGTQLGYHCRVRDVNDITEECGPNVLCDAPTGNAKVLHMCPEGFRASCTEGCVLPWKGEL